MADDRTDPDGTERDVTDAEAEALADADGEAGHDPVTAEPEPADGPDGDAVTAAGDTTDAAAKPEEAKPASGTASSTGGAPVVRKKVVSRRVTPKGAPQGASTAGRGGKGRPTPAKGATKGSTAAHAHAPEGHDAPTSKRYTPPSAKYADMPSPWWVPALMFGLLIIGALIIILNYMEVFGDAENIRLVIGLGFILGGIITATQYR